MSLKDRLTGRIAAADQKAENDRQKAEDNRQAREKEQEERNLATALALVSDETVEAMLNIAIDNHFPGKQVAFALVNGVLSPVAEASPGHLRAMDQYGLDFKHEPYTLTFDKAATHQEVQDRIHELSRQGIAAKFLSTKLGTKPVGIHLNYSNLS